MAYHPPNLVSRADKNISDPIIRIRSTQKNRVPSQNLYLNLIFGQSVMSKFKSKLGSGLDIQIRTNSDNRTIEFRHWTTMFMYNFSPSSLEKFIKKEKTSDNEVRIFKNRVGVRSHKIWSECPKSISQIRTLRQPNPNIGYSDLGPSLARVSNL